MNNEQVVLLIPIISIALMTILLMNILVNQSIYKPSVYALNDSGSSAAASKEEPFSWMHVLEGFIGGVAGVGVAVGIFFAQIRQDRKKEIIRQQKEKEGELCRLCHSIVAELEDHRRMLVSEEYSCKVINKPPKVNYRNVYLNTEIFDSIANSGHLLIVSEFDKEKRIMQEISDLYVRVKKHNEIIGYRTRHRDEYYLHDKSPTKTNNWEKAFEPYEEYLTDIETQIKEKFLVGVEASIEKLLQEYPR